MTAKPTNEADEMLLQRYWDGDLGAEELLAFNQRLLSEPGLRAMLREQSLLAYGLAERLGNHGDREQDLRQTLPYRSRRKLWAAGLMLAASLAVVAVLLISKSTNHALPIARVHEVRGEVRTEAGSLVADGQEIVAGEMLRTVGLSSSLLVSFADGTRVFLAGETAVRVESDGPKAIRVLTGDVAADVEPQPPGLPMRLMTSESVVEVLGTRLTLSQQADRTQVGVIEGKVKLTRLTDGSSELLLPGQQATASVETELRKQPLTPSRDRFETKFEGGLPRRWQRGQFVANDLPPGSQGAVRAVPIKGGPRGLHHQILSANAWTAGLAEIHEDSVLHVLYRVDKPGYRELLLVVRHTDPMLKQCDVLRMPLDANAGKPGEWLTVHVPLAEFRKTRSNDRPEFPRTLFQVLFDSHEHDIGMAVERYWLTRGND